MEYYSVEDVIQKLIHHFEKESSQAIDFVNFSKLDDELANSLEQGLFETLLPIEFSDCDTKKKWTEYLIARMIEKHNFRYDYFKVSYEGHRRVKTFYFIGDGSNGETERLSPIWKENKWEWVKKLVFTKYWNKLIKSTSYIPTELNQPCRDYLKTLEKKEEVPEVPFIFSAITVSIGLVTSLLELVPNLGSAIPPLAGTILGILGGLVALSSLIIRYIYKVKVE